MKKRAIDDERLVAKALFNNGLPLKQEFLHLLDIDEAAYFKIQDLRQRRQHYEDLSSDLYQEWVHVRNPMRQAVLARRESVIERILAIIDQRIERLSRPNASL